MQPELSRINQTEMIPVHTRFPGQRPELSRTNQAERIPVQSGPRIHPVYQDDSISQSFNATGFHSSTDSDMTPTLE